MMPAQKDYSVWKETEGDHADDITYERVPLSPEAKPTDEQRTEDEVGVADEE
jgi:hypothetical protein